VGAALLDLRAVKDLAKAHPAAGRADDEQFGLKIRVALAQLLSRGQHHEGGGMAAAALACAFRVQPGAHFGQIHEARGFAARPADVEGGDGCDAIVAGAQGRDGFRDSHAEGRHGHTVDRGRGKRIHVSEWVVWRTAESNVAFILSWCTPQKYG